MDPDPGGNGVDRGRVDVRIRLVVEVAQPFVARKIGCLDPPDGKAPVPVVTLGQQQLGRNPWQESGSFRHGQGLIEHGTDRG